jgi:rhodanese-related sulfurtransferase
MNHPLSDPDIEVTPQGAADKIAEGAVLVDVREQYEVDAGYIEGSRHVELERLASSADSFDKDTPIVFQCRGGVRSLMAAQAFRRAGFEAYSMSGGIQQWSDEGRPLLPEGGTVADH